MKTSLSKDATGRSETSNKPTAKIESKTSLPLAMSLCFLRLAEKGSGPSQAQLSWKRQIPSLGNQSCNTALCNYLLLWLTQVYSNSKTFPLFRSLLLCGISNMCTFALLHPEDEAVPALWRAPVLTGDRKEGKS